MKEVEKDFIVHALPVLQDNIIWIWVEKNHAVVVDPSIAEPVKEWLNTHHLTLEAVLQTHHHHDHIGGTEELLEEWPQAKVIASKSDIQRIPFQTISVKDEDEISLMGFTVRVISVPGHTSSHIAFIISSKVQENRPVIFCGDTLFGGGCGRIFEGTSNQMYKALRKINTLPACTQIYPAHEYTLSNLIWASSLFPRDLEITERIKEVRLKREKNIPSLPSSIRVERRTNLFLRAKNIEEFKILREHKDKWKG